MSVITDPRSRRRISIKYLPPKSPLANVQTAIVLWLFMDKVGASDMVKGIAWTLFALCVAAHAAVVFLYEPVHPKDIP